MPNFGEEVKQGNIQENWLFILNNDGAGAVYIAFKDEVYNSNFYHGVITNKPSIRESINLSNSTAKSGNISIQIPDFKYGKKLISEELFGSTDNYINQVVSVHSMVNGQTPVQIGSFRLTDISSDGSKLSLSLVTQMAWDRIETPNVLSPSKIYAPISYGNFTEETGIDFYQNYSSTDLRPTKYDSQSDTLSRLYYISGTRSSSNAHPSFFSKVYDKFIPYRNGSTSTTTLTDVEAVHIQSNGRYSYYAGATSLDTDSTNADITVTNLTQTYNYNLANGASFDYDETLSAANENNENVYTFNFAKSASGGVLKLKYDVTIDVADHGGMYVQLDLTSTGGNISTGTITSNVSTTTASVELSEEIETAQLTVNFHHQALINDRFDATVRIYEAYIEYDNFTDEVDIADVYIGIDGDDKGWTAGTVTEIHEAHRSLLYNYTNLDVTTDPDNWSNLDSDKDWTIRWWQNDPEDLGRLLEKLQYEGGFIFRYKADGTPQYIHIRDSNTTNETLNKYDIKDLSINHTPFPDLLTQMDVSYEKHPAENRYLTTQTSSNSPSRTSWNIQAKENIQQVNLDAYVSPTIPATPSANPNDDFYTYYDNIFGTIKTIVSGTIVNTKYYGLDVGDIIEFENMYPEKIFGESWSGKQYMITSLHRSTGTLKFEAREI